MQDAINWFGKWTGKYWEFLDCLLILSLQVSKASGQSLERAVEKTELEN